MSKAIELPESLYALNRLPRDVRAALWARFVPHPFAGQNKALWYHIQCARDGLRLAQKYQTKLRRYVRNPESCMTRVCKNKYNLTPGTVIVKVHRGREHRVTVCDDGAFMYEGNTYKTLSAVAGAVSGLRKISGPDFFGFSKRKTDANK